MDDKCTPAVRSKNKLFLNLFYRGLHTLVKQQYADFAWFYQRPHLNQMDYGNLLNRGTLRDCKR